MEAIHRYLKLEITDRGVAILTLDRPEKRNALDQELVSAIEEALDRLATDPSVKVVVFTGVDKAFVSGADIAELKERGVAEALAQINSALFAKIERFVKPTIAMINGYALGGGLEMALACDLRTASVEAKLGQPEVGLGILPGAGGCYRLPRVVGLGIAKELVYSGRIMTAEESSQVGLVNRVADAEQLRQVTLELADSIARQSALAVRLAKMS